MRTAPCASAGGGANSCILVGPKRFFFFYLSSFFLGTCGEISQRGITQCGSRSLVSEVMEPVIMWYFVDPWGGLSLCCSVGKWEWRISHSTTSLFKHKIKQVFLQCMQPFNSAHLMDIYVHRTRKIARSSEKLLIWMKLAFITHWVYFSTA